MSGATRFDFNGIVVEIGNAPFKLIQSRSYGEARPTLIDINRANEALFKEDAQTAHSSTSSGRSGSSCMAAADAGGDYAVQPEPEGLGHHEASSKLAGGLAGFQVNQKPAADTRS